MEAIENDRLGGRIQAVQPPIIPIVGSLIRANPGTISLGQGVVFYGPPPQAFSKLEACFRDAENHHYGAVHGTESLRAIISNKLNDENKINVAHGSKLVVTAGSNMGFYNAILAIADPGDEIILQIPYYFNHEMAITLVGCKPVFMETDADYRVSVDAITSLITSKTKAIVTISPNNPTGAVYSRSILQQINRLCRENGIYHISDEAYEHFVYDDSRHFSPGALPDAADYTISLFSLSKAYGLAGWRIGYMVIPEDLFDAIRKIQDTILICPPVVSQYAALGAMENSDGYRTDKIKIIDRVRRFVVDELRQLGTLIDPPRAEGAFYILLRVHTDKNDMALLRELITQYRVAAVPGTAFGITDGCYFRIAYGSLQMDTVLEGIGRLIRGLKTLA